MEKAKKIWSDFLRWPGWTAWLKWSGWKKIGSWNGWGKLLYPHPALTVFLALLSAAGLTWVFWNGYDTHFAAYPIYCLSFYALVVFSLLLVKQLPNMKKRIDTDPLAQKILEAENKGAFGIGMYAEQFINFFYGIFKIGSGILVGSAWIGADGIYNFVQALIQLYQILRHKQAKSLEKQWKSYRQCGYMVIVLHLTMTGMVFQMIHMGRHEDHSEIMIIATAAFTFYKLVNAIIDVAKDRKHKSPVDSAARYLNFSQALYNLFVLQVGLLWAFGGPNYPQAKLMNSLTGGAVCLLVCGLGLYMVWRGTRDLKRLEETELG